MMNAFKAELRKLFTVRMTYFLLAVGLIFVSVVAFYGEGIRGAGSLHDPNKLANVIMLSAAVASSMVGIVGLLLLANEYRYNTISYTLTAARSRIQVLLAKIAAVSALAITFSLAIAIYAPLLTLLGLSIKGLHLDHQTIHYASLLWRVIFSTWGYAMAALLIIALVRNQVAAIVTLFLLPSTGESLLSLLLKHNSVYLPFTALGQLTNTGTGPPPNSGSLAPGKAALVFSAYLIIGWLVAGYFFLKRDAN